MNPSPSGTGALLRAWRDRLSPVDAGITVSSNRRAVGLRREELASLAGLSVDYVVRLEQGRALHPSAQVVSALARALHLDHAERDQLYRSAGLLPPADGHISSHIPAGVQRLVARLNESPLAVFTADWTLVSWNPLWSALQGDPVAIPVAHRNLARAVFGDAQAQRHLRPSRSMGGVDHFSRALVADLRAALLTYPTDSGLLTLIKDLLATSPQFDLLWSSGAAAHHETDRKTIDHPDVGQITLDCDVLTVPGSDLRLVVFSAPADTNDARRLEFLRVTQGLRSQEPMPISAQVENSASHLD